LTGIVRLETGETKNDEGRTVYLDEELKEAFTQAWKARKKGSMVLPCVFMNHKDNDKIKQFNKVWATACKDAGIGKRLFHYFRRTEIRNMVRAYIPESVADGIRA
jgi:integrase